MVSRQSVEDLDVTRKTMCRHTKIRILTYKLRGAVREREVMRLLTNPHLIDQLMSMKMKVVRARKRYTVTRRAA